ncbi:MAG: hypothetical protein KAU21_20825 [Gammaproteobacteria bacterium]|nr:hypothetical protein [Gammaproteobacteria bacterium]
MFKSIKVGIYDWVKFPAQNGFYPEDLPIDWKLSFYANEFETACINIDETLDFKLFLEWLDDLPDDFELSFNLIKTDLIDQLAESLEQGSFKINYLLVPQQERDILLRNESFKAVLSRFEVNSSKPQRVISSSSLWTPDNNVASASVALLPDIAPDVDKLRLYRRWIELWLDNNSQHRLTLWLDGKTARYSSVSELRTLVELMGY